MATGPKHKMDLFETTMQSQPFYLSATLSNGQLVQQPFLGILEPINLYRYVMPKEGLGIVLSTLGADREKAPNGLDLQAWALRKALNLQSIPKGPYTDLKMPIAMENINLTIIPIN